MAGESSDTEMLERIASFSTYFGLNGSDYAAESPEDHATEKRPNVYHHYPNIEQLLTDPMRDGKFDDVAELCGGAGDTGALLVRRGYHKGPNFDIVAGYNMRSAYHLSLMDKYTQKFRPHIFIISTPCTGMKGFAGINKKNALEADDRSLSTSLYLANLGARTAMGQMNEGRHFIAEHLKGSQMWTSPLLERSGQVSAGR